VIPKTFHLGLSAALILFAAAVAQATEPGGEIRFQDHHFVPQKLSIPAGQPSMLKVTNASNETIEFESFKLNREKALSPGETISVRLPALDSGTYDFYDDFHQDVPQGAIVVQ
jgi:hypothetical protein